jgi:cobalt-zinc-cadmium efflux system outer membrane protein
VASAEWKAAIDVRQAWTAYRPAIAQVAEYTGGMLIDAERVRRAKLYSYQHGTASLLDVLTAEQTANDVYIASYDAEQQYEHALIALGQATGTWSFVYGGGQNGGA